MYTLADEKATPMLERVSRNSKYALAGKSVSSSSLALHYLAIALFINYLKTSYTVSIPPLLPFWLC